MNKFLLSGFLAVVAGITAYHYLNRPDPSAGTAPFIHGAPAGAPLVARGAYLARAADCVACHTAPGGAPFAGGLAFKLPFGRLYSSNITADPATGIGNWSDDDFVRALQEGVRKDGKHLYAAFPYTSYAQLSRDDVLAIKAYLFSLPPVWQATPEPELAFLFNQRWAIGFWNAVFFKSQRFVAQPSKSSQWNSGAYLAGALAHCAECHTPRNAGFALDLRNDLSGAAIEGWRAPNITSDRQYGIGAWSDEELYAYLRQGHAPGRGAAGGPMAEAVENSLQHLDREDVLALIAYLRGVPGRRGEHPVEVNPRPDSVVAATPFSPLPRTPDVLRPGLSLFEESCASCHRWNGNGAQTRYASLTGARSVSDPSGESVTQIILRGADLHIGSEHVFMPRFDSLSDTEIAQLANYVIFQFGGKRGTVSAGMVAAQRDK